MLDLLLLLKLLFYTFSIKWKNFSYKGSENTSVLVAGYYVHARNYGAKYQWIEQHPKHEPWTIKNVRNRFLHFWMK